MYRIGDYTFTVAPNSRKDTLEYVGADVTALSGRTIIQPSYYKKNLQLTARIWKPLPKFLDLLSISGDIACGDKDNMFILNTSSSVLSRYNRNLVFEHENNIGLSVVNLSSFSVDGADIYVVDRPSSGLARVYVFDRTNLSLKNQFDITFSDGADLACFTALEGVKYLLDSQYRLYRLDYQQTYIGELDIVPGGYFAMVPLDNDVLLLGNHWFDILTIYFYNLNPLSIIDVNEFNYTSDPESMFLTDKEILSVFSANLGLSRFYIGSSLYEITKLKKALLADSVLIEDQYRRKSQLFIESISINRVNNLDNCYDIDISGFTIL
jgi:hypothetical protein